MKDWESYQKVLSRLVKGFTGLSVDQQLRLMVPHLTKAVPEEALRAKKRYEENPKVKTKNKLSY